MSDALCGLKVEQSCRRGEKKEKDAARLWSPPLSLRPFCLHLLLLLPLLPHLHPPVRLALPQ